MSFPNLHKPSHIFATWFGIGLLKPAPGTWGSLAGLLIWYFADFLHSSMLQSPQQQRKIESEPYQFFLTHERLGSYHQVL